MRENVKLQTGVQVWRCESEEFCKCGCEQVRRCRGVAVKSGADVEMWKCAIVGVWGDVQVCKYARLRCGDVQM